jgi:hypothetical protein
MTKKYDVTCINSDYQHQGSMQLSAVQCAESEEFDSKEEDEKFVREVKQQAPQVVCSIREAED